MTPSSIVDDDDIYTMVECINLSCMSQRSDPPVTLLMWTISIYNGGVYIYLSCIITGPAGIRPAWAYNDDDDVIIDNDAMLSCCYAKMRILQRG